MQQGTEFFYDNWCVISNFEVLTESEKSIFICIRKRIFPSFSSFLPNCKRMNIWWDISQIVHAGRRFPTVWMIIYHRQRWTDGQKESGTSFDPIRALEFGISKTMSTRTEKSYRRRKWLREKSVENIKSYCKIWFVRRSLVFMWT